VRSPGVADGGREVVEFDHQYRTELAARA
jgi:hypothetical protein